MSPPYPLDPLSAAEIKAAIAIVKKTHGDCFFNVVSLHEPRKAEMLAWLASPSESRLPARIADVVVIKKGGKIYDGLVDLAGPKITKWELLEGAQPIVCRLSVPDPALRPRH
jgi:primary-amine oxidase